MNPRGKGSKGNNVGIWAIENIQNKINRTLALTTSACILYLKGPAQLSGRGLS